MLSSEVPSGEVPAINAKLTSPFEGPDAIDDDAFATDNAEHPAPLEKHVMAHEMLNDILETAMDIAESGEHVAYQQRKKMNIIDDEDLNDQGELQNIIYGLSRITVNRNTSLNAETKQMIGTIMNPPKHLGLGDSPPIDEEHPPVLAKPSKLVEKKTRITDLVMNSRKVLTNMLNEEQRTRQDAWEETNEHVIQVIELQQEPPMLDALAPEIVPLPYDEDEDDLLLMPPDDPSQLESVDLGTEDAAAGTSVGGKGDEKKSRDSLGRRLSLCSGGSKSKKWFSHWKPFTFWRNRRSSTKRAEKGERPAEATAATN